MKIAADLFFVALGGKKGLVSGLKQKLHDWIAADSRGTEMEGRESENRKVKRRYRRAAERIWGNSSLRDELNDEQAQRLLDWGNRYLKQVVDETADLGDEDAEGVIDKRTDQVSNVLRRVNRLTKSAAAGEPQEITDHLQALRKDLDSLLNMSGDSSTILDQMTLQPDVDSSQVFESLMNMLDGEEE